MLNAISTFYQLSSTPLFAFFYLYDFIDGRRANLGIVIFEDMIENIVLFVFALYRKKNGKEEHFSRLQIVMLKVF
jgi:hypothetical protein